MGLFDKLFSKEKPVTLEPVNVSDDAIVALQMPIPMIIRMIVPSRIEILIAPVYTEIQFHGNLLLDLNS